MSHPTTTDRHPQPHINPEDPVEAVVPYVPYVLPIVGAVLIFLLAFIAVSMG